MPSFQVGTSSFAASHISHAADHAIARFRANPQSERPLSATAEGKQGRSATLSPKQREGKHAGGNTLAQREEPGGQDGRRWGDSVSPQESCAQGEATAGQPLATAEQHRSTQTPPSSAPLQRQTAHQPLSIKGDVAEQKKGLSWSKLGAAAFNAGDLDPEMNEVGAETPFSLPFCQPR